MAPRTKKTAAKAKKPVAHKKPSHKPVAKKQTTTTAKTVVKPPVKKVVADSPASYDSPDSAPSADS